MLESTWDLTKPQLELQARARAFAEEFIAPRAGEIDRSEEYPWDNVRAMAEEGFTGMTIPSEFGGAGLTTLDAVLVVEELAKACAISGRIAVEANLGAVSAIMAYGTEEQKKMAAELVLAGDKPAICITEPEAGSAASMMTTRADRSGDRYILNGKKHWITGGGVSRLYLILARVFDEQGEELGIGGFLAVRDQTPGLKFGKREPTMGLRGIPELEIICEDMEVTSEMVLVSPPRFPHGFGAIMDAYNAQRVGAATVALGLATGSYELAHEYVFERHQFGRPLMEFQGLQWMLADMLISINAARGMLYRAARSHGKSGHFPDPALAAQAKIFTCEHAIRVVSDALQLFGAAGYSRNNPLERMYRDVRMFTIGGGTAQVLRNVVASKLLGVKLAQTRGAVPDLPQAHDDASSPRPAVTSLA